MFFRVLLIVSALLPSLAIAATTPDAKPSEKTSQGSLQSISRLNLKTPAIYTSSQIFYSLGLPHANQASLPVGLTEEFISLRELVPKMKSPSTDINP